MPARIAQLVKPQVLLAPGVVVSAILNWANAGSRTGSAEARRWRNPPLARDVHVSARQLAALLGNMWFLWLFGNNVEDRLGTPFPGVLTSSEGFWPPVVIADRPAERLAGDRAPARWPPCWGLCRHVAWARITRLCFSLFFSRSSICRRWRFWGRGSCCKLVQEAREWRDGLTRRFVPAWR